MAYPLLPLPPSRYHLELTHTSQRLLFGFWPNVIPVMLCDANITVGGSIKCGTTAVYQTVVLVDVLWVLDSDGFLARYI